MLNGPTRSVPVLRDRSSGRTGTNRGPRSRGTVQDWVKTDIGPTFQSYKILSKNVKTKKKRISTIIKNIKKKYKKKHTNPSLPFVYKSPFRSNVISERSGKCYCKKKEEKER